MTGAHTVFVTGEPVLDAEILDDDGAEPTLMSAVPVEVAAV